MSTKASQSDSKLLHRIREGDEEAEYEVYARNFSVVFHFVLANNGSEEEAEDIYQETMIIVFEHFRRDDFELSASIKTYIYAIARRLWLKYLTRSKRRWLHIEEYEQVPDQLEQELRDDPIEDQLSILNEALDAIGQPCNTIIQMFYVQGYSMKEIADQMGYTNAENAKNQKYKCMQRLKTIFGNLMKANS